jgi:two-component system cell cycle response regulator
MGVDGSGVGFKLAPEVRRPQASMSTDWDDTTSIAEVPDSPSGEGGESDRAYLIVIAGSNVGEMHKIETDNTILGRSIDASIRLTDDGISRHHCRIREEDGALFVEDLGSRNGLFCNGVKVTHHELQDGDKIQLGKTTILKFSYQDDLEENFQKKMLESALTDGLTGAYNKRYFMERLDSEVKFSLRHKVSLGLMIMDLDKFKLVNDTYGHLAGDAVLTRFAELMHHSIRNEDVFARYGGEEFAIITRAIPRPDVYRFADRLRQETSELVIMAEGVHIPITVSIGLATLPEDEATGPTDLIKIADTMLYEAKRGGRNRVMMSSGV